MFRNDLAFLSNMYQLPMEHKGMIFLCVEAAYQASKCETDEERQKFVGISGKEAKALGRTVKLRADWEKRKVGFMLFWLRKKFSDFEMKNRLSATCELELVEHNTWGDRFWGVCDGVGHNMLGRLLMQVRAENMPF